MLYRYSTAFASIVALTAACIAFKNTSRTIAATDRRTIEVLQQEEWHRLHNLAMETAAIASAISAELSVLLCPVNIMAFGLKDEPPSAKRKRHIRDRIGRFEKLPITEIYDANRANIGQLGPQVSRAVIHAYKEIQAFRALPREHAEDEDTPQMLIDFVYTLHTTDMLLTRLAHSYDPATGTLNYNVTIPFSLTSPLVDPLPPSRDALLELQFVEWPDDLLEKHGLYRAENGVVSIRITAENDGGEHTDSADHAAFSTA